MSLDVAIRNSYHHILNMTKGARERIATSPYWGPRDDKTGFVYTLRTAFAVLCALILHF